MAGATGGARRTRVCWMYWAPLEGWPERFLLAWKMSQNWTHQSSRNELSAIWFLGSSGLGRPVMESSSMASMPLGLLPGLVFCEGLVDIFISHSTMARARRLWLLRRK